MHILKMCYWLLEGHTDDWIMNLFGKLKLNLYQLQKYFTPPTHESKTTLDPGFSQAQLSYTQHFLFVNFSNCASQCHISYPTTAHKHQWAWHAWCKSHSKTNPLNQNSSRQRKKNYGKITEISVSLAFLLCQWNLIIK